MKLCRTCRYGSEYELDKPCIVYREDCPLYEKEGDGMTNEKAIEELKAIKSAYRNKAFGDSRLMRSEIEALDLAIKALESIPNYKDAYNKGWNDGAKAAYEHLKMCEEEQGGDLISRQAVLKIIDGWYEQNRDTENIEDLIVLITYMDSVNPQEPKWNMLLNWLNDMRFGIAPDETVTDIDELHCREAQTDILDEIMDWMKKQTPKSKCLLSQKYRDWLFIQEPKESDHKCHTCKHYTSGEYDGSCDSYICKGYSDWESENKE